MARKPVLSDEDIELFKALVKKARGRERLRLVAEGKLIIVDRRLFEDVGPAFRVRAHEEFIAESGFYLRDDELLCISHIGENFRKRFLPLVEEHVPHEYLRRKRLRKRTSGKRMLPHLGQEEFACIKLAHLFSLMVRANRGVDNYLVFCRDAQKRVWAIIADQSPNGWWLEAVCPLSQERLFDPGRVVVSKDIEPSDLESR